MPTDYKALEQDIVAGAAKRQTELEASQAADLADALAVFRNRAKPLAAFLLPELEALRTQMDGKYAVEIAEELTSADAGPETVPSVSFEVINTSTGMRSGRVTVRISRLSATAAHRAADGLEVSVAVKASRDGQDRHGEDLLPALGIDRRASLDQALAEQIVRYAFGRVAGVSA
jgi:hypothetical protein